jgi:hypothetical protein
MKLATALVVVKSTHTVVWVFFVACIVAVPVAAHLGRFEIAAWAIGTVLFEVVVLLINRWRCPLTGVAARYTDQHQDNFDIYLPLWLARHNKTVFGWLFVAGFMYAGIRWWLHTATA